jgi:diguanylate cyclase (GGDEF)-like protein
LPVHVLLVEDSEDDALLLQRALRAHAEPVEAERVDSAEALTNALARTPWDIVISDFQLPGFGGLDALEIVRRHSAELPFILVSGTVGEETAVDAMRAGANDYVMKNKLARLLPAFQRELREAAARRRSAAERRMQQARIEHLTRVKDVMSAVNATMLRVRERGELAREACRIAVETGGFTGAWIGLREGHEDHPRLAAAAAAHAPLREAIGEQLRTPASPAEARARDVMAHARAVIRQDPTPEAQNASAAAEWATLGVRSTVTLPLRFAGRAVGVLELLTTEPAYFDAQEMRLLEEMAGDIAFALDHIAQDERLDYLAFYDPVSGLANRALFAQRLAQRLRVQPDASHRLAVCALQLEKLSEVNDIFGRQTGDALVAQMAARLEGCLAEPALLARVGPDRFAFAIAAPGGPSGIAARVHAHLHECTGAPYLLGNEELVVMAHAGISLYPDDGAEAEALVRNAETAVARPRSGAEQLLFYAEEMSVAIAARLRMEIQLRKAIANDEFLIHYQPQVDALTRRVVGMEALLRWRHPDGALVGPMEFIPVLEETGLIVPVGAWVLRQAASDRRGWIESGLDAPRIAVNISSRQLLRADFVATVLQATSREGHAAGIDLEITESGLIEDFASTVQKLLELSRFGFGLSIDDFGTGYSSLAYMVRLPAQTLKLDRSFVIAMLDDPPTMTLVAAITNMAHSLGLRVVAEGVETEAQAAALASLHCDHLQGYLTGRPMPAGQLAQLLDRTG